MQPRIIPFTLSLLLGILLCALATQSVHAADTIFVKPHGTGNGSSWAKATNLQQALTDATAGDEIWVATGVYTPGVYSYEAFSLKSEVAIYGGFAATETLRTQRDWLANPTVLSGDIGGDDITDANGVVTDTSKIVGVNNTHIVKANGQLYRITSTTVLDGFTITAAKGAAAGGGFTCDATRAYVEDKGVCTPHLENIIFSGNSAEYGGAMSNKGYGGISSPTLVNVLFTRNTAEDFPESSGGAMHNTGACVYGNCGESSPTLINVTFVGNTARGEGAHGGAIYNVSDNHASSSPTLINVTFSGNSSDMDGGALYSFAEHGNSSPTLINVTFAGNSAGNRGGAIFNRAAGSTAKSAPSLTNVILWGNTAITDGAQIFNYRNGSAIITNSLIEGGINGEGIVIDKQLITDTGTITDGGGNLDGDPLFVNLATGNLRLQAGSPAIDAGLNSANSQSTDLDDNPRKSDGDGDTVAIVDMGAYEFQLIVPLTVTVAGTGQGEVAVSPAGDVSCNLPCRGAYLVGSNVTLTATAPFTSTFDGWSGACSGTGACQLTISVTNQVTATFTAITTGTVAGKVVDAQKKGIAGATVTLTNEGAELALSSILTQSTDSTGDYLFTAVPFGSYTLTVHMAGKEDSAPQAVNVHAAETSTVSDITLQPAPVDKPQLFVPLLNKSQ